jgi:glycosyltransferase involved in cell wall biosynthesis
VPYEERHTFLLDADAAVSAHLDTLETRLSFRTRFLDHLWAGLPTITTEGGELADAMAAAGAATLVGERDVAGWTSALLQLASDASERERMRDAAREFAPSYRWSVTSEPLAAIAAHLTRANGGAAPAPRPLHRRELLGYARLLVRVRAQSKGLGSLPTAVREARGR